MRLGLHATSRDATGWPPSVGKACKKDAAEQSATEWTVQPGSRISRSGRKEEPEQFGDAPVAVAGARARASAHQLRYYWI